MSETHCPDCGHPWESHDAGVPRPYCPNIDEAIKRVRQAIHGVSDISIICDYAEWAKAAGGFCEKHTPTGGKRSCQVCAVEKLSHAISRIDYALGQPNDMHLSDYDIHFNEQAVVERVKREIAWKEEDPRMLREQLRLADAAYQLLQKRYQAIEQQLNENH